MMTPRDILTATQGAMIRSERSESDRALLAMHDLFVGFLDATDKGCPDSMKTMLIDQIRVQSARCEATPRIVEENMRSEDFSELARIAAKAKDQQ